MAHYAFLNEDNIVTEVIVGKDENEDNIDWEVYYGNFRNQKCKRTSYNTYCGTHKNGGTPYRGNFAGMGHYYDETLDAFIPPQPSEGCILNTNTYSWEC